MKVMEKMEAWGHFGTSSHVDSSNVVKRVVSLHILETMPLPDGTERDIVCITPRRLSHSLSGGPVTMAYISDIAEAHGLKPCPMVVLNVLMQRRAISIEDYAPDAVHNPDTLLYFVLPRP
jgi:hypothetical protein